MNSFNASAVADDSHRAFDPSACRPARPPVLRFGALGAKLWAAKMKILALACLCALLAAAYGVLNPPTYQASARILIDPRAGQSATANSNQDASAADISIVESQLQVITSDSVLSDVVEAEKLALDPEFGINVGPVAAAFGSSTDQSNDPKQRALQALTEALSVSRVPDSFVVDVSVTTRSARKSARIAQAVADTYVSAEQEAKASQAGNTASQLSQRLDELRADLKAAEDAVERYKSENRLDNPAGRLISDQQLSQLSTELIAARARAAQSRSKFEQIERFQRAGTSLDTLADAIQSEIITQLRVRLASLRAQMVARQAILHPDNPELKQMRDQAASLGRQINVELERIASSAKAEAVRLQTNVLELERELEKRSGDNARVQKSRSSLRALERVAEAKKALYEAFLAKTRQLSEQNAEDSAKIRIVSAASAPAAPIGLPVPMLALLGFGAGLIAGAGFVAARASVPIGFAGRVEAAPIPPENPPQTAPAAGAIAERMNAYAAAHFPATAPASLQPAAAPPPVSAPAPSQPASTEVSLPLLATVSGLTDPSGLYPFVISDPISLASAGVGQLNKHLRTTRRRGLAQTVLVGACGAVEARPGIAMNLALIAAAGGDRVLLVDADFSNRALSATLASTAVLGLGEVVGGVVSPGDVMIKHPNLTVAFVPAAEHRDCAEPVLNERALREQVIGGVSGFDLIIFDGGELSRRASTPALGAIAHDIVLIADQNHASHPALHSTLEILGLNRSKVRGTLSVA
ncbi:MAG: exopolysaccharide transport family protein [Pseudomonadota bacterium]